MSSVKNKKIIIGLTTTAFMLLGGITAFASIPGVTLTPVSNVDVTKIVSDKSRSRKTGGAVLGLSIVKTIVEKHGWKIAVDTELGRGSTFAIIFAV
ncbi:MAG: ATP-binding protein [Peptococcaceae bacterium]